MNDCDKKHHSTVLLHKPKSITKTKNKEKVMHDSLPINMYEKLSRQIQSVRQTRSSQYRNNPFSQKSMSSKAIMFQSMEFINYKQMDDERIEITEKSEKKIEFAKNNKSIIAQAYRKNKMSTIELEDEMFLEIRMSSLLTEAIEKELLIINKLQPILPEEIAAKQVLIPRKYAYKNTVILDLDETLIHTLQVETAEKTYNKLEVINLKCFFPALQKDMPFQIIKRPSMDLFIEMLSLKFEIIVFTAGEKYYADAILDAIDPFRKINFRLYRENCIQRGIYFIKDLRILNRDLANCIIIDNSVVSFMGQLDNGIPITSFVGDKDDSHVYSVCNLLNELHNQDDVRPILRDRYCLSKLLLKYKT